MLFVRELTVGEPYEGLAISGVLGFRILPALLAAPLASSLTDRFDRRRTMILTAVVRAALIAVVPFAPHLAAVYAIAFAMEAFALVFLPARDSVVPNLVRRDRLAGANALIMITQWGFIPVAGGFVVAADAVASAVAGVPFLGELATERMALPFFFNTLTLLAAAWLIGRLPAWTGTVPGAEKQAAMEQNPLHTLQVHMSQGVRYLLRDRGLRGLVFGMALAAGAGGALFSLGIPYVKSTLAASDSVFGTLIGLWGIGMAFGAIASQRSRRRESDLFRLSLGVCGGILVAMGAAPSTWLALALSPAFGAGLAMALVLGITLAQRTAPEDLRGRVMSAVHVLARVCLILGAVLMGVIAAALGQVETPPHWDGNQYAFVLAGVVMIGGGMTMRGAAGRLEKESR